MTLPGFLYRWKPEHLLRVHSRRCFPNSDAYLSHRHFGSTKKQKPPAPHPIHKQPTTSHFNDVIATTKSNGRAHATPAPLSSVQKDSYKSPWQDIFKPDYSPVIKLRTTQNLSLTIRSVGLTPLSSFPQTGSSTPEEISNYITNSQKDVLLVGLGVADFYRLVSRSKMKDLNHPNTPISITQQLPDGHYLNVLEEARRAEIPLIPLGRENSSKIVSMLETMVKHPFELVTAGMHITREYFRKDVKEESQGNKFSSEMLKIAPNLYRSYFYKDVEYLAHATCVFCEEMVTKSSEQHYKRDKSAEITKEANLWRKMLLKLQTKYMKLSPLEEVVIGKRKELSVLVVCNAPASFSLLHRLHEQLKLRLPTSYHKGRMMQIERQNLLLFVIAFSLYILGPIIFVLYGFWKTVKFLFASFIKAQQISVGGEEVAASLLNTDNEKPTNKAEAPSHSVQNLEKVLNFGGISLWYRDRNRD